MACSGLLFPGTCCPESDVGNMYLFNVIDIFFWIHSLASAVPIDKLLSKYYLDKLPWTFFYISFIY